MVPGKQSLASTGQKMRPATQQKHTSDRQKVIQQTNDTFFPRKQYRGNKNVERPT